MAIPRSSRIPRRGRELFELLCRACVGFRRPVSGSPICGALLGPHFAAVFADFTREIRKLAKSRISAFYEKPKKDPRNSSLSLKMDCSILKRELLREFSTENLFLFLGNSLQFRLEWCTLENKMEISINRGESIYRKNIRFHEID